MKNTNDNVGKCGHAKCAGGDGTHCYAQGAPMQPWAPLCEKHGEPAHYTQGRCIKCMDTIPLNQLEKPDFTNKKLFNI